MGGRKISQGTQYLLIKSASTVYYCAAYAILNMDYESGDKVGKAFFYLTTQQIVALAMKNGFDLIRGVKIIYQDTEEDERYGEIEQLTKLESEFSTVDAVINAQTAEVSILFLTLLRTNLPKSLFYHVTPTAISALTTALTKNEDVYAINKNYLKKYWKPILALMVWNGTEILATLIFELLKLTNPDKPDSNSVYPGTIEYKNSPGATSIVAVGITLASGFFSIAARGPEKLMRAITSKFCCTSIASREPLLENTESVNASNRI